MNPVAEPAAQLGLPIGPPGDLWLTVEPSVNTVWSVHTLQLP